nr:MAG TPA: hypothetical protein [Caudoviricetes sp.]
MFTNCSPLFTFVHQSKKDISIQNIYSLPVQNLSNQTILTYRI